MKRVICKSGIEGYQCKLQENYDSFEEFERWNEIFNLAKRLGYRSAKSAWFNNPTIQGSVNPSDYRKVKKS